MILYRLNQDLYLIDNRISDSNRAAAAAVLRMNSTLKISTLNTICIHDASDIIHTYLQQQQQQQQLSDHHFSLDNFPHYIRIISDSISWY